MFQRHRVYAVPQPGWIWTVIEHVPEMRIAAAAANLGPHHSVRVVRLRHDRARISHIKKARPTAAGMKFLIGSEQLLPATHALVLARSVGGLILACEGRLSSLLPRYVILVRRKLFFPLCIGLL